MRTEEGLQEGHVSRCRRIHSPALDLSIVWCILVDLLKMPAMTPHVAPFITLFKRNNSSLRKKIKDTQITQKSVHFHWCTPFVLPGTSQSWRFIDQEFASNRRWRLCWPSCSLQPSWPCLTIWPLRRNFFVYNEIRVEKNFEFFKTYLNDLD